MPVSLVGGVRPVAPPPSERDAGGVPYPAPFPRDSGDGGRDTCRRRIVAAPSPDRGRSDNPAVSRDSFRTHFLSALGVVTPIFLACRDADASVAVWVVTRR